MVIQVPHATQSCVIKLLKSSLVDLLMLWLFNRGEISLISSRMDDWVCKLSMLYACFFIRSLEARDILMQLAEMALEFSRFCLV